MAKDFKVGQFFTRKDKKRGKEDIEVTYKVLKVGPKVVTVLVDPKAGERGEEGSKPTQVNMTKAQLAKILKGKGTTVNEAVEYLDQGYEGFRPGFYSFEESKLDKSFVNKIKQWVDYAASGDIALGRKVVNEAFDELDDDDDFDFENGVAVNVNLDGDNEDWNGACADVFSDDDGEGDLEEASFTLKNKSGKTIVAGGNNDKEKMVKDMGRLAADKKARGLNENPMMAAIIAKRKKEAEKKKLNNEDFGAGKIDAGANRIKKLLKQGIISKEKAETMLDKLDDSRNFFKRRSFSEGKHEGKKKSKLTEGEQATLEKILKGVPSAKKLAREKQIDIDQAKLLRLSIAQKIMKSEKGNRDIK